jgi:hypothetical protein
VRNDAAVLERGFCEESYRLDSFCTPDFFSFATDCFPGPRDSRATQGSEKRKKVIEATEEATKEGQKSTEEGHERVEETSPYRFVMVPLYRSLNAVSFQGSWLDDSAPKSALRRGL